MGVALFWGGRSVVQCGVADDEEPLGLGGADSPWAHDLPIGEPAPLPAAWTAAPVAPGESRGGNQIERVVPEAPVVLAVPGAPPQRADAPTPGHRHRRAALLIGVAALFAAAVVGSQLAGGGDDATSDDDPAAAAPDSVDDGQVASTSSPSITVPRRTRLRPTTSIAEQLPPPPPEWVTSTVALDPRVAAIAAPTQLVALAGDGTLHVIDLSTGTMRSIDTGQSGTNSLVSLGASDVLLSSYSSNSVTLARGDVPPVEVAVEGGVGQVIQRAGTDEFILVPITWSPNSRDVLRLGSDAQVTLVSTGPLVQFDPWQIQFIRTTGQMIVNDAGGVYLVDENGVATRTSTGDLLSMGPNHYIVRECDESRVCAYVRIEQATGQRDVLDSAVLDQYRPWADLSSLSLSPDGTAVTYADWQNGGSTPVRRMIDLTTGTSVEVGPADQFNNQPAWAADSSGLFVLSGRRPVFYDRATGEQIPVASGLDDIAAVATSPITG